MSLRFVRVVADENIPHEVVESLRKLGLKEVFSISDSKRGITDAQVWQIATTKQAILITGDLGFLPQLRETQVINGPDVIEYRVTGFARDELKDPRVMEFLMNWLFRNNHHSVGDHLTLRVDGKARSKRQVWGIEKQRRRRAGLTA
ncbi:MAG: DUF5615 family PIN-like protein [Planctomycetes bacterium]|nr:DUF5615 family PIN-like protein [Planctomycetota bacterium]